MHRRRVSSTNNQAIKDDENKAVLAVSLDKQPDEAAVKELGELEFVNEIYVCKLD